MYAEDGVIPSDKRHCFFFSTWGRGGRISMVSEICGGSNRHGSTPYAPSMCAVCTHRMKRGRAYIVAVRHLFRARKPRTQKDFRLPPVSVAPPSVHVRPWDADTFDTECYEGQISGTGILRRTDHSQTSKWKRVKKGN